MKSAEDFLNILDLTGKKFSDMKLDELILNIHSFSEQIWKIPQLYNFVDHGIEHSYRVARTAMKIFREISPVGSQLSSLERCLLGVASLIHDIGMQYNKYPEANSTRSKNYVRTNHCELGFNIIKDALQRAFDSKRGGPGLQLEKRQSVFLYYGALIGFAHSGRKYWDLLKEDSYKQTLEGGLQLLRYRLLAALIRFADELHCEYTRIPELNWLDSSVKLSSEAKAHWTTCYYTKEIITTSPGHGSLRVTLRWRSPKDIDDPMTHTIIALLQDLRQRKIRQEMELIKDYLKVEENTEPSILEFNLEPSPEVIETLTPLPQEVFKYVQEELRPYQFGIKKLRRRETIKEIPDSEELIQVKYRTQNFFLTGQGVITGHFSLNTGWHTDKYVKCRKLCADYNYVSKLCHELAAIYKKHNFTDILSVGTSAISIGILLSFLLKTRFHYTFGDVRIASSTTSNRDYTQYEIDVSLSRNKRILLIDDILAKGNVLANILEKLAATSPPKYLRLFTIYVLGDMKDVIKRIDDIDADYVSSFPDVKYYKQGRDGMCELCRKKTNLIAVPE